MSSWTDPDIKNHVKSKESLNVTVFMDKFTINNTAIDINNEYRVKSPIIYPSITLYHPSLQKLIESKQSYVDNFKQESSNTKYEGRPMLKTYSEYKRVDWYQILLAFNSIWSSADFETTNNTNDTINYPSSKIMGKIFSEAITNKSCPPVKEIEDTADISEALNKILNSVSSEYNISNLANDRVYVDSAEITKLLNAPIIKTYLSAKLNAYTNGKEEVNDDLLKDTITSLLQKLNIYVAIDKTEEG